MDKEIMFRAMIAVVGTVEILKKFINSDNKKLWTAISIVIGIGVGVAAYFLPPKVLDVWIVVCGSTVLYDTILKTFKQMITKLSSKEEE